MGRGTWDWEGEGEGRSQASWKQVQRRASRRRCDRVDAVVEGIYVNGCLWISQWTGGGGGWSDRRGVIGVVVAVEVVSEVE